MAAENSSIQCFEVQELRNALRVAAMFLEAEARNADLQKAIEEVQEQRKIVEEGKLKEESNARDSFETELSALKSDITALLQKCDAGSQEGNGDVKTLQVDLSGTETEINRLKELLKQEQERAESEMKIAEEAKKKATELRKQLQVEIDKNDERLIDLVISEEERNYDYKAQTYKLTRELEEMKKKLASEVSKYDVAIKTYKAEKKMLLADLKIAQSKKATAKKNLMAEKKKTAEEKKRADAELAKLEQQKKIAEANWKRAMEAENFATQMSQKLREDKLTIENLQKKLHELQSGGSSVNAESANRIQHLEASLQLEKSRADHERERFLFEADRSCFLQHQFDRLRQELMRIMRVIQMLDPSVAPPNGNDTEAGFVAPPEPNQDRR